MIKSEELRNFRRRKRGSRGSFKEHSLQNHEMTTQQSSFCLFYWLAANRIPTQITGAAKRHYVICEMLQGSWKAIAASAFILSHGLSQTAVFLPDNTNQFSKRWILLWDVKSRSAARTCLCAQNRLLLSGSFHRNIWIKSRKNGQQIHPHAFAFLIRVQAHKTHFLNSGDAFLVAAIRHTVITKDSCLCMQN